MLNNCQFIGNLTKDVELVNTNSGNAMAKFTIACNEKFGDKNMTEFVNITTFGKLAEICKKYLTKGQQIYVSGRLQTRSYDDRDGNKRYVTGIVARDMKMLGRKKQEEQKEEAQPIDFDNEQIPF